jgi:hypothetical protein
MLRMAFHEIDNLMPFKEPSEKSRMFRSLLKLQTYSHYEFHLRTRLEAEYLEVPDNDLIENFLGT